MTFARMVHRYWQPGEAFLPIAFFLIVISLGAFAAGPNRQLLTQIGPGTLWTAALLASLVPVGTLLEEDIESEALDQLRVAGLSLEAIMAVRILAHWLGFAPALVLSSFAAVPLLGVSPHTLWGLPIGAGALAALGVVAAALLASVRNAGAVAGVLVLPLALPVLIFGVGEAFRLLAASTLIIVAAAPFAAAAALRVP